MADAMGEVGGKPESAAAALSALLHFLDRPTVDLLRQVLGLTSSGTVRLVDRMTDSGYVQRGPGSDGRSTTVTLTDAGLAAAERVAVARAEVLEGALAGLTDADRDALRRILGTVLAGLIRGPGATRWMCRLCDTGACRGAEGGCPVGNAARENGCAAPADGAGRASRSAGLARAAKGAHCAPARSARFRPAAPRARAPRRRTCRHAARTPRRR